jgi:cytochrome c oxidase cbb3-type subunit 3
MPTLSRLRTLSLAVLVALGFWLLASSAVQAQEPDPEQIELGARLYAENCAVCHGDDGQGRVGATLAKNWPSIRPDATIRTTIENGISGSPMPPWGQSNGGPLSPAEVDALVAYILTWETGAPRIIPATPTYVPRPQLTPPPDVSGDPNHGADLYDQNCAVCHGSNGEGRVGATLAKNFPSIRPDLTVSTTIANGVQGSAMPAWSQANGGPLSEGDIDDLTVFILTLPSTEAPQELPAEEPESALSWLSGWGGVLVAVLLLGIIVAAALLAQRRKAE